MTNQNLQHHIEDTQAAYQAVRLSADEKAQLKRRVLADVETLRRAQTAPQSQRSPWFATVAALRFAGVAFMVLVLIGAPVAFAAERSLPGDTLYTIKTDVNEPIAGVFAADADAYQQSLLVKRASELRVLAKYGKLDAERVAIAQETLVENVHDALVRAAETESGEGDTLQDYQVIVALISESAGAVAETAAVAEPVAMMAAKAVDTTASLPAETAALDAHVGTFQLAVAELRAEATQALEERIDALADATPGIQEAIVEELVADAVAAGEAIVEDTPVSTAAADGISTTYSTFETTGATSEPAAMQVRSVAVPAAREIMEESEASPRERMVEQVLEVHQKIAQDKASEAVEKLTEELDTLLDGGAAVSEAFTE